MAFFTAGRRLALPLGVATGVGFLGFRWSPAAEAKPTTCRPVVICERAQKECSPRFQKHFVNSKPS